MALEGVQLGQYRLVRLLGSGGMGEVYLAEDARISQQVAIKVSRTDVVSYPHGESAKDAVRLFQREAKAIARLDHPRILPLFGYGEENVNGVMLTYIVMAYRPEGSFAQWLQQRGTAELLPMQDITYFIHQAADALQYAHDHQVVHQDVKPANFLLRANKENPHRPDLLLTDFGIARLGSSTASISHSIRGTPTYMAPEQWSGEPVYATDQYALAVLAYELLAGRTPFVGRQEQIMYQHFNIQPQAPSTFNPLLPNNLDSVILQALAKNPEERFPSIAAFAHALEQAAEGVNASTERIPPQQRGDLYATLAISKNEAANGANRTLTLPGWRRVTVSIPPHAYDGQILRLEGLGEPSLKGGLRGTLVLTLSVKETDATQLPPTGSSIDKTLPASNPGLASETALPLNMNNSDRISPGSGPSPFASNVTEAHAKRGITPSTAILLIGLAVLVLMASFGFFYLQNINRSSPTNNDAVATTQAQDATTFAITATAQTNNFNTTSTAIASNTATVVISATSSAY
ncbi:MAG TPA: protein kinase, partial [Ktedonobacteraceae bacterium]|nr:protein kinase [Ktedonobacteraceae bacterium]